MLDDKLIEKIKNEIAVINRLTYASDRIKKAIQLKENIYNDFNNLIDELFSNLNLKKKKNE